MSTPINKPPDKVTVVCPHCGCTGTYRRTVENGSGGAQCVSCHKSFRIYFKNGYVDMVKKT